MQPSLLKHLVIPAALIATYGCTKKKENKAETAAATGIVLEKPNACVPNSDAADPKCTEALIAAHTGKEDGFVCNYESCKIPESGVCDPSFKPGITSTPPTRDECRFQNPVDL